MNKSVKAMLAGITILIASVTLLAVHRSNVAANPAGVSGMPTAFSNYGTVVLNSAYTTNNYFVTVIILSSSGPFYLEKLIINQLPATGGIAFTDLYGLIRSDDNQASGQLNTGVNVCFKASFATPKNTAFGPPGDIIQSMYASTYGRALLAGNTPPAGGLSVEAAAGIQISLFPDSACSKIMPANDYLQVQAVVAAPSSATVSIDFIHG